MARVTLRCRARLQTPIFRCRLPFDPSPLVLCPVQCGKRYHASYWRSVTGFTVRWKAGGRKRSLSATIVWGRRPEIGRIPVELTIKGLLAKVADIRPVAVASTITFDLARKSPGSETS
jgi:hypothetical protein